MHLPTRIKPTLTIKSVIYINIAIVDAVGYVNLNMIFNPKFIELIEVNTR